MTKLTCILLALALLLLLAACAGQAETAQDGPLDGDVTDNSDPGAPKTIESKQIIAFDCRFSTLDLAEPGALGNHIYQLHATLENGAVKATYQIRDTGEERSFRESHSFLNELQTLVEEYDLAQYNGHSYSVAGLPDETGAQLEVQYASRESIRADDNQDNFLPWGAMDALIALFERGAAVPPTVLPLCVGTQYDSVPLADGLGEIRYPVYRLDKDGFDGLSAALASRNELWLDGAEGELDHFRSSGSGQLYLRTDAFVTRTDSVAVSFYERTERYESAGWEKPMTSYEAHNLDAQTGKELRFADVFRDMEHLPGLLREEFERACPDQAFYDDAPELIRQSIEREDGSISFALGYGCVHVFANEYVLSDVPGGQHITLSYVLNPSQVRAFYTAEPYRWLIPLDYDTLYWKNEISVGFRMHIFPAPEGEDVLWAVTMEGNDAVPYEETFYGHAPDCWLARVNGRDFIYLRVPAGDVSMRTKIYEVSDTGISKRSYDPVGVAMRNDSPLDPDGMLLSLNEVISTPSVMMLPYGTFRVDAGGLPEHVGDEYRLNGPWVQLREGGRYNPDSRENAAVSGGMWTLIAGQRMRPYRTDLESWIDFITDDERVVRFEIDRFADDMHLDNFGTLDDVFAPEGVG